MGYEQYFCLTFFLIKLIKILIYLILIKKITHFKVLGKSCKPIPIMIFGVIFAHKRYALKKYFFVFMIVVGMAVFLYKDNHHSKSGHAFEFGRGELFLVNFSFNKILEKKILTFRQLRWAWMVLLVRFKIVLEIVIQLANGR